MIRLREAVSWSQSYRFASYAKGSLWIVPFFAIGLEMIVSRLVEGLDARLGWTLLGFALPGAKAMYDTIITMTLSFMVFTFGSLLVAIQVASGQLTPRIIAATLLRDNTVRYTVGLFVFTLLYAVGLSNRMENTVSQLSVFTAGLLGLACLAAFLFLIDYAARLLRPASIVWLVGESGIAVLAAVHPEKSGEAYDEAAAPPRRDAPDAVVLHEGSSGTVLAVNKQALVALARASSCMIELVPHVGDFIAVDEPLFLLYGGVKDVPADDLRAAVAVGPERTMEQDTTFSFRILIDIALKGLSSSINDPTTAVLAIDQIHRLLRSAGRRHLQHDHITDARGRILVIVRTPNWEDYVHLACREIRLHAGHNIQIPRRLRAMLENLMSTLPERRHGPLKEELELLDRMVQGVYTFPEDLALARIPDAQGIGGATTVQARERQSQTKTADAA